MASPIPCPCCRAANESGPACRRCRADLSALFALEDRRAYLVAAARGFAADRPRDAVAALDAAAALRPSPDLRRLRAAALLLAGDFSAAVGAHARAAEPGRPAG